MDDGDARQYESIRQQPQQEPLRAWEGQAIGAGLPPAGETASGSAGEARLKKGPSPGPPGRWPALVMLPAAIWGVAWASTVGLASICYAALASAAAIAAAAFGSLAPGATAAASRFGIADSNAAAAAAVASVDWVDVALRTAAGLMDGVGGSGRVHILEALQDAGSSPGAAWAVTVVLPGLCALAGGCRAVATAVRTGLPWLEPLAQMAAAAAGLGVLTVLAMPLRRFLAPLVPVLPRERPSGAVSAALRVGGAACMVAVLTALQTRQLAAPPLVPSIRSAVAAAATSSPLLLQTQAVLYGVTASVSDALLPACTAVFAGIAIYALLQRQYAGEAGLKQQLHVRETGAEVLPITSANAPSGQAAGSTDATAAVDRRLAAFGAVRALAACRLVLDALLLVAVAMGVLPGKISAIGDALAAPDCGPAVKCTGKWTQWRAEDAAANNWEQGLAVVRFGLSDSQRVRPKSGEGRWASGARIEL
ncbi:hypothetical protein VOLCADRAFT_98767 [Volvox carteri f. nagariensis]|uniref:Uncharacterized protein n=1 Tax=Volvox carteri f. nagariensis TaxID=3068 RepID=D8UG88_VOLCA|nr:uncharacterized protein VOLCADRAFT_98767 [Volvox carteri f. nagariensis]EFJ41246.1 hypothetical protein VOLCADRAFT_98767 [Volvox carteri f. nagariensis]|eukprot:XP_002957697.1 hypothetical protein VOLCADRAFT_98767 [Volvox carteri f. nagariensis]